VGNLEKSRIFWNRMVARLCQSWYKSRNVVHRCGSMTHLGSLIGLIGLVYLVRFHRFSSGRGYHESDQYQGVRDSAWSWAYAPGPTFQLVHISAV